MKIAERIYLQDDNYFADEVTIADTEYLTAPRQWTWMFSRNDDISLMNTSAKTTAYMRMLSLAKSVCGSLVNNRQGVK